VESAPLLQSSAPTPAVASPPVSANVEVAVVIGAWSDCFRPESADARPGQLVQWQAAEAGITPELVLDNGASLGRVQHVLEFRFVQPGTYRYHVRSSPQVTGTIVVR
jgi:plastocyanin